MNIVGNFGEGLNLAIWRIWDRTPINPPMLILWHFNDITELGLRCALYLLSMWKMSTSSTYNRVECQIKLCQLCFLTNSPNIMLAKFTRYMAIITNWNLIFVNCELRVLRTAHALFGGGC